MIGRARRAGELAENVGWDALHAIPRLRTRVLDRVLGGPPKRDGRKVALYTRGDARRRRFRGNIDKQTLAKQHALVDRSLRNSGLICPAIAILVLIGGYLYDKQYPTAGAPGGQYQRGGYSLSIQADAETTTGRSRLSDSEEPAGGERQDGTITRGRAEAVLSEVEE